MSEYLIEDFTNYDQPGDKVPMRRVGMKGLVEELARALNNDKVCIAVYEINEIIIDWTAVRSDDEECEVLYEFSSHR